jgi:ABC-type transport system involved in cytochrome c biogenesis permease subunit
MSVVWLRVAVALYSVGLIHALLTLAHRRRDGVFRLALGSFYAGVLVHLVSIVEHAVSARYFPANDFYESVTLCGFLIALLFLFAWWRYQYESLAVFVFPLVFVLTLVGELGSPVASWNSAGLRGTWLLIHVVLVLVGYAALVLTAIASVMYLLRERQLKGKRAGGAAGKLPPLNALDQLMARSLSIGFVFMTLAVIAATTWASIEMGTRWVNDPRIIISLVTWLLYLVVVFVRVSAGWRGRRAAVMLLALVGCSVVTWAAHTSLRTWLAR